MQNKNWLAKIFDVNLWQSIQDSFSKALNLPITTIDAQGNELLVSNEPPFFYQIIRSKRLGWELTKASRLELYTRLKDTNERVLYSKDHTGLMNVIVPIKIHGQHVCAVLCDGIIQNIRETSQCKELAENIGVGMDELVDALNNLQVKNVVDVKIVGSLLRLFSELVPNLAAEKIKSDRKINELTVLNQISLMVNSTLDFDKILTAVMKFMLQAITAKTCSVLLFDEKKRFSITDASEQLLKVEAAVANDVKYSGSAVRIPSIRNDSRFFDLELEYNSVVSLPLKSRDSIIGVINLYGDSIKLDESDIDFLNIITHQVSMAVSNAKQFEKIKESAITDKLTGLYNRRHFIAILKNEIDRSLRFKTPLSVAMLDLDYFKHYNDRHGHLKGDKLLEEISRMLVKNVRTVDTVGRYGGEEFIIVLPTTKPHESKLVVERVRKSIEEAHFDHEEQQPAGRITISVGLVTSMKGDLGIEEMIMEADKNLYKAKAAGRNCLKASIVLDRNMNPVEVIE